MPAKHPAAASAARCARSQRCSHAPSQHAPASARPCRPSRGRRRTPAPPADAGRANSSRPLISPSSSCVRIRLRALRASSIAKSLRRVSSFGKREQQQRRAALGLPERLPSPRSWPAGARACSGRAGRRRRSAAGSAPPRAARRRAASARADAIVGAAQQLPGRQPGDQERRRHARGEQHVREAVRERRIEDRPRASSPAMQLAVDDLVAGGRLHPRVERQDPERATASCRRRPANVEIRCTRSRHAVVAEQHHAEERRPRGRTPSAPRSRAAARRCCRPSPCSPASWCRTGSSS